MSNPGDLGRSGAEGGIIGNDGSFVNSALNKNKVIAEAKAVGEAVAEGFLGKVSKGMVRHGDKVCRKHSFQARGCCGPIRAGSCGWWRIHW
jgi:hypothetical protein